MLTIIFLIQKYLFQIQINSGAILIPEISQNSVKIETTEDNTRAVLQQVRNLVTDRLEQTNCLQNKTELTDTSSTGERI